MQTEQKRHLDRLFFLHIPKTAGTSLMPMIEKQYRKDEIFPPYFEREIQPGDSLEPYRLIRGHFFYQPIVQALPIAPRCLIVLRNPIEQELSHFGHIQCRQTHRLHQLMKDVSIEELIHDPKYSFMHDLQTRMIGAQVPDDFSGGLIDKNRLINSLPATGEMLHNAMHILETAGVVGITEHLDEAILLFCYELGWHPTLNVPRHNVTPARLARSGISDTVLGRLEDRCRCDLATYHKATSLFWVNYTAMCENLLRRFGTAADATFHGTLPKQRVYELVAAHHAQWTTCSCEGCSHRETDSRTQG